MLEKYFSTTGQKGDNMANLAYTYDEMITRSEEISTFAGDFKKEVDYLSQVVNEISKNLQSAEAQEVYQKLASIKEEEEDIQAAMDKFAIAIRDEIAPTYQAIEKELAEEATSYYG